MVLVVLFLSGCNYKEQKLRKEFVGKVWIIDEARKMDYKEDGGELISMSDDWNYILKPEKDSTFGLYRDQEIPFENFKIKGDTLFLKSRKDLNTRMFVMYSGMEMEGYVYMPYKFVKTGKYSATLFAYDTNNLYYELYLTIYLMGNQIIQNLNCINKSKNLLGIP